MEMSHYETSRRGFLKTTLTGVGMTILPAWAAAENRESERAIERGRRIGQNDMINIAVIGPGGPTGGYQQGLGDTRGLQGIEGVKVVAACDVDKVHLDNAIKVLGGDLKGYHDYRDLLANKDIDAVVIGTPDHWHSQICIDAAKAGKDIYCEKPLTLVLHQGREIVDAVHKGKRVFQTGSQQRSDGRFRLACELVRNGRIGKLRTVQTRLPTGPTGGPFETKAPPTSLDYNMWLGPAADAPYCVERVHGNFRWWLDYSGGMLTDWGAHHHDIAHWGMGMDGSGPLTVRGEGKTQPIVGESCYSTFPEFDVYFDYPDGVVLHSTNKGENGVMFEGDEGWIFVSREKIEASDPKLLESPLPSNAVRLEATPGHGRNFIECIRSRKDPICHAEVGHRSVSVCHLANTSLRLGGRRLRWDAKQERFIGDEDANRMLVKQPRRWDR
jgi:predicted dehydrogenase